MDDSSNWIFCETLECSGRIEVTDHEQTQQIRCASCLFGKLNVVLDLDETLVCAQHKMFQCETNVEPFAMFENYQIYKRPYVDLFLETVFKCYNVYIFTAAQKSYADYVLKCLLKSETQKPIRVLTSRDVWRMKRRDGLMSSYGDDRIKIKPLKKLHINFQRTVMLDDTASCFSHNVRNGILVKEFDNPKLQQDDTELLMLLKILQDLADCNDVRNSIYTKHFK